MREDGAMERFFLANRERLVGALRLRLADSHLAEEVAQEAFARTFAQWDRVAAMDSPEGWLFRVAFNLARSHWRRESIRRRVQALVLWSDEGTNEDVATELTLRDALEALTPRQREVVILRYYVGMGVDEAASALGVSPGTVKTLAHRAMASLRAALGEEVAGER